MTAKNLLLYDHPLSGNCHKIRMFLSLLGLPYRAEFVDVVNGATRTDWFAKLNPLKQIPVLVDDQVTVQDSQAILLYLAMKYGRDWISDDPAEMAAIAEWLSYAAKEVSNGPQLARLYHLVGEDIVIEKANAQGLQVLAHLDAVLTGQDWLCMGRPTIADLAVFPYVAICHEGKLPLNDHPSVVHWIERIAALPGYVPMRGMPGFEAE
jgi:glutathione S-transferase